MRHYLVAEGANMDPRQAIDAMEDAVNDAISDKYEPLGAAFSVVAARHDDPVRTFPAQSFQDTQHDRLLPLQTERVHTVAQVDGMLSTDLPNTRERIVEVTSDLQRAGTIVECL